MIGLAGRSARRCARGRMCRRGSKVSSNACSQSRSRSVSAPSSASPALTNTSANKQATMTAQPRIVPTLSPFGDTDDSETQSAARSRAPFALNVTVPVPPIDYGAKAASLAADSTRSATERDRAERADSAIVQRSSVTSQPRGPVDRSRPSRSDFEGRAASEGALVVSRLCVLSHKHERPRLAV